MGRTLRTRDLSDEAHAQDLVRIELKLLPLLGDEGMRDILREVLRAAGWTAEGDGRLTRAFGEAVAELDPEGRTVTLRAKASAAVKAQGSAVDAGDTEDADKKALAAAKAALASNKQAAVERLEAEVTQTLTRAEPSLREALQEALNRAYREALEERARQMGEVESVVEQGDARGGYEVTVVVRA